MFIEFGTPDTGHWCDHCMKPSAVVSPLTALRDDGVRDLSFQAIKCQDCGRGWIEDRPSTAVGTPTEKPTGED